MNIQDRLTILATQPFVYNVSIVAHRRGAVVLFEGRCELRNLTGGPGADNTRHVTANGQTATEALEELRKTMLHHLARMGSEVSENAAAAARAIQTLTGLASLPTEVPAQKG